MLADEERFRFLNGFNDVFLTIGVLLIAGAFLTVTSTGLFGLSWVATLDNNKVPLPDSVTMVIWVGAALILLSLIYTTIIVVTRRRARRAGRPVPSGFEIAGIGMSIRFAMSELGPLEVGLSVSLPTGVMLVPQIGLVMNDFTANVQFFSTLPSI